MKVVLPVLILAALVQAPTPNGTIEVLVQTAEDSVPVSGVSVGLSAAAGASGVTDGDGRVTFSNLADGMYEVRAGLQEHYAWNENRATSSVSGTATLTPFSRRSSVTLRVNPAASISGKITNTAGQPLNRVGVAAASVVYRNGRPVLAQANTVGTNANGEYRLIGIVPGNYLIVATPPASTQSVAPSAYFPGVPALDSAVQIPIRGGEQVQGIDFVASAPQLFKVTGKVLNPPAAGVPNITFAQRDRSKPEAFEGPLLVNTSSNASRGEFELMLPAGSWNVFPVIPNRAQNLNGMPDLPPRGVPAYTTGRVSVEVKDRNVDGLTVTIGSTDITGRIAVDSSVRTPGFSPANTEVRLVPVDSTPAPLWHHFQIVTVGADGKFTFAAVPPGAYRLQVARLSAEVYISDIRIGQTSIFNDAILQVKAERVEPVEVVLSAAGGTVRGNLQVTGRALSSTALKRVVLVPMSPRRENPLLYRQQFLRPEEQEFQFVNVAPGPYKVFAFEDLPSGGAEMNTEYMSRYESSGESITVASAGTVRASVRLIEVER